MSKHQQHLHTISRQACIPHQELIRRARLETGSRGPCTAANVAWADRQFPLLTTLLGEPDPRGARKRQYALVAVRELMGLQRAATGKSITSTAAAAAFPGLRLPAGTQTDLSCRTIVRNLRDYPLWSLLDGGAGGGPANPVQFAEDIVIATMFDDSGRVLVAQALSRADVLRFEATDVGRGGGRRHGNYKWAYNAEAIADFGVDLSADLTATIADVRTPRR